MLQKLGDYQCISMGSSLKLCLVGEGAAHFYPRLGPTMEWDTAAAHAVVNQAGGKVCDSNGIELCYNKAMSQLIIEPRVGWIKRWRVSTINHRFSGGNATLFPPYQ